MNLLIDNFIINNKIKYNYVCEFVINYNIYIYFVHTRIT